MTNYLTEDEIVDIAILQLQVEGSINELALTEISEATDEYLIFVNQSDKGIKIRNTFDLNNRYNPLTKDWFENMQYGSTEVNYPVLGVAASHPSAVSLSILKKMRDKLKGK
jgi:hypothetical protein